MDYSVGVSVACRMHGHVYCHYRHPTKILHEVALRGDQFWFNTAVLCGMYVVGRFAAFLLLRWKLSMVR
ncbi:hypothetical protein PR048_002265 [Dryococelus australis]|uniref:Uncharacterized protein n=1 Tax=Dryococelus australis TaxID=614101 RepID=A0ABQ9IL45_9NEOP|nr:hypothetical protein PR048_002265 [Dryococelus australis]